MTRTQAELWLEIHRLTPTQRNEFARQVVVAHIMAKRKFNLSDLQEITKLLILLDGKKRSGKGNRKRNKAIKK